MKYPNWNYLSCENTRKISAYLRHSKSEGLKKKKLIKKK